MYRFSWLAEAERDLTTKRTKAGLAASKRRGVKLGRKPKLTAADVDHALRMIESGAESVAGMSRILKVDRNTLRRVLRTRKTVS